MSDKESTILFMENLIPLVTHMGIKVDELEEGYTKLTLPLKGNENHMGSMYAGALFSLAEFGFGPLAATMFDISQFYGLIKHMEISYWRPATTDISIEVRFLNEARDAAVAEALESGKADFVIEADLTDANGKTVASTKGVYQVRALNFKAA